MINITNERRIRTTFHLLSFNTNEIDPVFFGSAKEPATAMLNDINNQLEENRKFIANNIHSPWLICLYIFLSLLILPIFVICIIESRRANRLVKNIEAAQEKMKNIVDKYNPSLQQVGFMSYYGEDAEVYFGSKRSRRRVIRIPYFSFVQTNMNMQMNNVNIVVNSIQTESNVFVVKK
jgi:hypothetical protein